MDRKPQFDRLEGTSRDLALEVLYYCNREGMFAHKALATASMRAKPAASVRKSATEIAFGAIRRMLALDYAIAKTSGRTLGEIDPLLADILRIASYQIVYMRSEAGYAVVDSAVEQAKKLAHKSASGFVNAVLRKMTAPGFTAPLPDRAADPALWLSVSESHPRWMVDDWIARFGFDRAFTMCRYDNEAPPASIRRNSMKASASDLASMLLDAGMESEPGSLSPYALVLKSWEDVTSNPKFSEGYYSVQDQSSMLVAEVLDLLPGETVLDICSAPGGKACHAAEIMNDRGRVVAADSNAPRLELVNDNARRLGLKSVETVVADARTIHSKYEGAVDAVIADLPCSGLGVLSRRPDARWRKDAKQAKSLAEAGASMLDSAAKCLKIGGRMAFSTCTVSVEENENQLRSFLDRHPGFGPVPIRRLEELGYSSPGSGYAQLLQGVHGSDGFFISLISRLK